MGDYSENSILVQRERFPELKWKHADVRNMPEFKNDSIDMVIEKALLDGEGMWKQHRQMFSEISRVLRPGGRYVSISLGNPDELNTEEYFHNASYQWSVQFALGYDEYYVYTMTKSNDPQIVQQEL